MRESHAPQAVTTIKPFNRSTSQPRKRYVAQIIRGAAKARFRRILRAGFADAHTAPYRKFGFTLAEVLITLAIIGVVAALTIPTLITTNQEKGWNTAAKVFERKLEESLKVMNTQQTLAGYRNTEDFVNELSKHLKITKICKNDDILSCFEDKVYWGAGEATPEEVDMSKIKTAKNFGLNDWDTDLVGIQLANGTSGVIAYNPKCKQNPFSNQITGRDCIAILYDTSGFTKPNTSGKDLRAINVSKLGRSCAFEIAGTCYGTPFYPEPIPKEECSALGLLCDYDNDYLAGAVAVCGGIDKMPTMTQWAELADYFYGTSGIGAYSNWYCPEYTNDCWQYDRAQALGFDAPPDLCLWVISGERTNGHLNVYGRSFCSYSTHLGSIRRDSSGYQTVCIVD